MKFLKYILTTILLACLVQTVKGTTWAAAYPYTQKIEGQDVVIKAYPYDPYSGSPMIGITEVYLKNKLIYTIDKYYRDKIFTSNDGQYLAVVHTSNFVGVTSYGSFGYEQINYNQIAIEVYKNGQISQTFSLKEVVDTTKLLNNGQFFNWGYSVDFEAIKSLETDCETCIEVYGKRTLKTGNAKKITPDELNECRNYCDALKLKKSELKFFQNAQFVEGNHLYVLTNQNTVVKLNFSDSTIEKFPFDKIVQNKEKFNPPKLKRKYHKIKLPGKFDQPKLKDGRTLEKGIAGLFGLSIPNNEEESAYCIFIDHLVINKKGKCISYYGNVYDEQNAKPFTQRAIDRKMAEKLEEWIMSQTFDTKLIPRKMKAYSFLCIMDLK